MKTIQFLLTLLFIATILSIQAQTEKDAVIEVIEKGYVQGLHNNGDLAMTQKYFHPGFNLLGVENDMLTKFPIYSWIQLSEKRRQEPNQKKRLKTTAKYPLIDITGNAAIAKVELYREKEKIFTDYLMLYKFEEGWRIVSKIYHRHQ